LNGKWFEEWLWLAVRDQLLETDAEVLLGLEVIAKDSANLGSKDFDFDVAVFANDQLHVIECKAGHNFNIDEINRLSRGKTVVLGPFGKAWLARAQGLAADAKRHEIAGRAELLLRTGKAGMMAMPDEIRRVVL
jgi:hypothetical protein